MPACCVAGVCFFLRALQPYAILVLSWGQWPFFAISGGSTLHVILEAVLTSKRPKFAREGAGTAEPRGQAAHFFVLGFSCLNYKKGVSEKNQKMARPKKSDFLPCI